MDQTLSPGLLLVLSAPSGAGKTTLAHRLIKQTHQSLLSISFTTRSPRGQEKNGVDYHFVDAKTFQEKIEAGEFVEWAEVHGHFYGSPKLVIEEAFAKRSLAVFDIDVQGGLAIKRKYPDALLTFILPPSIEELERRLRARKTDSEETIGRRMLAARAEIEKGQASYDFLILNDDLERAYEKLQAIVTAESCRRGRFDLSKVRLA